MSGFVRFLYFYFYVFIIKIKTLERLRVYTIVLAVKGQRMARKGRVDSVFFQRMRMNIQPVYPHTKAHKFLLRTAMLIIEKHHSSSGNVSLRVSLKIY